MGLLSRIAWTWTLLAMISVLAAITTAHEPTPAPAAASSQQIETVEAASAADPLTFAREPETIRISAPAGKPWRIATEEILEK